jgi:PST family polysaccharide transporter
VLWACAGVGVAFAIHSAASLWVVHRDENLSIPMLTKPYLRPLLACLPMALCVVGATRLADHFDLAPWVTLLLALVVGIASYVAGALTVASVQARDLLSLVRDALGRGRDTETRPVEGTST